MGITAIKNLHHFKGSKPGQDFILFPIQLINIREKKKFWFYDVALILKWDYSEKKLVFHKLRYLFKHRQKVKKLNQVAYDLKSICRKFFFLIQEVIVDKEKK